jgi:hypothetical protein
MRQPRKHWFVLTKTAVHNPRVLHDPVPHLLEGLVPGVLGLAQFLRGHDLCLPGEGAHVLVWPAHPLWHLAVLKQSDPSLPLTNFVQA